MSIAVIHAQQPEHVETMRTLLREYAQHLNQSLGEEHICLASYEQELAELPGPYAPPEGAMLIAQSEGRPAGCVALKPLKADRALQQGERACEMKRLWVRPEFRGQSIGLLLAQELIVCARELRYTAMYLDTVPTAMRAANAVYHRLGFERVGRYNTNPVVGVEFFRLTLL
jgi:putative acetyltransferase